jgi:hypothetical protein
VNKLIGGGYAIWEELIDIVDEMCVEFDGVVGC